MPTYRLSDANTPWHKLCSSTGVPVDDPIYPPCGINVCFDALDYPEQLYGETMKLTACEGDLTPSQVVFVTQLDGRLQMFETARVSGWSLVKAEPTLLRETT